MPKRIGLFGGTFDPVHLGHSSLVHSFLVSGYVDLVWILLTPHPPHKEHLNLSGYAHRISMLQLAFKNIDNVEILDIESKLPKPSYTYKTIEYLVKCNPSIKFMYCMGSDSLMNFHSWKYPESILDHVDLLVAQRPGFECASIKKMFLEKIQYIDHQPLDISSTKIKSLITGNKSVYGLVHADVENYINFNQLYILE